MITPTILAKRSGASLHTVRHYTRIGLLKPARHAGNGYKIYQPSDEIRVRFIRAVKDFGFTLSEIAQILDAAGNDEASFPQVKEIVSRRVRENRRKIQEIKKSQRLIEKAIGEWSTLKEGAPDGDSVRRFVESVAAETAG
jgi:MerR family transcriptional regulator, Zn(II)-responsive regulator of zntA